MSGNLRSAWLRSDYCERNEKANEFTHPVDYVAGTETGPSEGRIGSSACFGLIPPKASLSVYSRERWQAPDIRSSAEVVNNEATHSSRFDSVDESGLEIDAALADNAYDSILTDQRLSKRREIILGADNTNLDRVLGREVASRDYRNLEAGVAKSCSDRCTEVSRGLDYEKAVLSVPHWTILTPMAPTLSIKCHQVQIR